MKIYSLAVSIITSSLKKIDQLMSKYKSILTVLLTNHIGRAHLNTDHKQKTENEGQQTNESQQYTKFRPNLFRILWEKFYSFDIHTNF